MQGFVEYNNHRIEYRWRRSPRKTLSISVCPDGTVEVVAPMAAAPELVEQRVLRRAAWVLKQQKYFEQFRPRTPERRFVGGETHLYLGRQYRLKIEMGEQDRVSLRSGFFFLTLKAPTSENAKAALTSWYRERARTKLSERYDLALSRYCRRLPSVPALSIAPMKRRWGSYSRRGRITLNLDLVRAPIQCIDYVIAHELAHARHPYHSKSFFNLLDQMMPSWRAAKQRLETLMA